MSKKTKTVSRNYRDNVFCIMHREKKYLLSLYNALNGTDYRDEDEITVVTLKDAICISMKNDAAYVLHSVLTMCEQQSTPNPNMALRQLFYVAEELRGMVDSKKLYRSSMLKIPEPHFVVFYNGEDKQPAIQEQRLSEMYERHTGEPRLELKVKVININPGYNDEFVGSCESLSGYMAFVCKVRANRKKDMDIEEAVRMAMDDCIKEEIMAQFFSEHREEVVGASIWEFNQELNDQAKYEDGYDDGRQDGYDDGRQDGYDDGMQDGRQEASLKIARGLIEILDIATIAEKTGLTEDEVRGLAGSKA